MCPDYEPDSRTDAVNVGAICTRDVTTVTATATLLETARLLCDSHVEAVVVIASRVSRPTAIGIITACDILRVMLERGISLSDMSVVSVLSRNTLVLAEDEKIHDALAKMHSSGVKYAPVVGPGGTLCGAVSHPRPADATVGGTCRLQ